MLSTKQFGQNKIFKVVAGAIVIGLAFLMFLPGSASFYDMFTGSRSAKAITVNGTDIYTKTLPLLMSKTYYTATLQGFLHDTISRNRDKPETKALMLYNLLNNDNWAKPTTDFQTEMIRRRIYNAILWQIFYELSQDLGLAISKEKLIHYMRLSFKQYFKDLYNQYRSNFEQSLKKGRKPGKNFLSEVDFYEEYKDSGWGREKLGWNRFRSYFINHTETMYFINLINSMITSNTLSVLPELMEEFKMNNRKIQVHYALYTFDQFLTEPDTIKLLDKNDLKEYYNKYIQKLDVKRATFNSEDEAKKSKDDPNLFKVDKKNKDDKKNPKKNQKNKYKISSESIQTFDDKYKKLNELKENDISEVIPGKDKKFYIYKITKKSDPFEKLRGKEFNTLIKQFGATQYKKLKADYEKKADEVMNSFLTQAKDGKSFKQTAQRDKYKFVKTGLTDPFTLNADEIKDFVSKEDKKNKKSNGAGKPINEFLTTSNNYFSLSKIINETFFKAAFSLKKDEVTDKVLSHDMQGKKVFFIIKLQSEITPDLKKGMAPHIQQQMMKSFSRQDFNTSELLLVNYLRDKMGYKIKINAPMILADLNLKLQIPKDIKVPEKKDTKKSN